jgi:hypothetical protein
VRPVRSCTRLKERLSFSQSRVPNPYGRGRLASNDGKVATSSSSQHATKRQKLDNLEKKSRFFARSPPPSERRTRNKPAPAILSPSPPLLDHATDAIVIEDDDTPDLNDSSSKPDTLTTSSPDPMDLISYTFDPSKPSPMHQFSSSLEETRGSPTDGESTARLRHMNQVEDQHSPSRIYGAPQSAKVPVTPTIETSAQPDGSPRKGKVKELASLFEVAHRKALPPHIDLEKRTKDKMKPKQVSLSAPLSGVPQPSGLRAPAAAGRAVTHNAPRSARHWTVWLHFWFEILKGESGSQGRLLQFTLRSMVHRSGHPSARSNTRTQC